MARRTRPLPEEETTPEQLHRGYNKSRRPNTGTFSIDKKAAAVREELKEFLDWLDLTDSVGLVGEFGWPRVADVEAWNAVGDLWMDYADKGPGSDGKPLWLTYWATGDWWGEYNLLPYSGSPHNAPNPQAATLEAHPSVYGTKTIDRVRFLHGGSEGAGHITRDYRVQYRVNPADPWTDLVVVTGNTTNDITHTFAATAVRQLRVYVEDPSTTDNATRIYEFEARNGAGGTNLALNRPVYVSGTANAATENGYHMVDANSGSKWCDNTGIAGGDDAWAIIDLIDPDEEQLRGVNVAGGEFGDLPGTENTNYTYSALATYQYLFSRGHRVVRLPFKWERIQPILGAAFDSTKLQELRNAIDRAGQAGLKVIVEPHNYGRYQVPRTITTSTNVTPPVFTTSAAHNFAVGNLVRIRGHSIGAYNGDWTIASTPASTTFTVTGMTAAGAGTGGTAAVENIIGSASVSQANFNDFWTRMSAEFNRNPHVVAYSLMNEPHDMLGSPNWQTLASGAYTAIRTQEGSSPKKWIWVPLDGWSGAQQAFGSHPSGPWISGTKFGYEAHHYWDHDHSGDYDWTYAQELAAIP